MERFREEYIWCEYSNEEATEDHLGVDVKRPGDSVTIVMKPKGVSFNSGWNRGLNSSSLLIHIVLEGTFYFVREEIIRNEDYIKRWLLQRVCRVYGNY